MKRFVVTTTFVLLLAAALAAQTKPAETAPAGGAATQANPASKPAITYDGLVTDKDGKPLAGATVRAFEFVRMDPSKLVPLGKAVTRDDGKYSFVQNSLLTEVAMIVAEKDGYALGCANFVPGQPKPGAIRLGVPLVTAGTIVDEDGKGIAGARIDLLMQTQSGRGNTVVFSLPDCEVVAVITDANGRFEFKNIPVNGRIGFILAAPGKVSTFLSAQRQMFKPGQKDIKIVLPTEAKVRGVLKTKEEGEVLADVTIQATPLAYGVVPSLCVTDKDGKFVIGSLPSGKVSFRIVPKEGTAGDWVIDAKPVTAESGMTRDVTLTVVKGGLLEVAVLEEGTNKPIPNAIVDIGKASAASLMSRITLSANDRGLALTRVPPGEYRASAFAWDCEILDREDNTTSVEEGQTQRIEITLKPMPWLNGVARDKGGKPVTHAEVTTLSVYMAQTDPSGTDDQGRFSVHYRTRPAIALNAGRSVMVRHARLGLVAMIDFDDPQTELAVTLVPGVTVKGIVNDANGKPLKDAAISVSLGGGNAIGQDLGLEDITTNDKGEYEIRALPRDKEFTVSATSSGYGQAKVVVIGDSDKDSIVTAEAISLPEAKLELTGKVENEEGKPVANAFVFVSGNDLPSAAPGFTDKDGKFTVKGLVEGDVRVHARNGRYSGKTSAQAGDTDVVVTVKASNNGPQEPSDEDDSDEAESTSQPATKPAAGSDF